MDYYGASDIDGMLAEFGALVAVTVNGQRYEAKAIVDVADEELLRDLQNASVFTGKVTSVLLKTGALPAVAEGSTLEVDGQARRVISAHQQDDGALTRVLVAGV